MSPQHRSHVTTCLGAPAATTSLSDARLPRAVEPRVGAVELRPVAVRALEVVADDLVLFDEVRMLVEPVGECFVELGSRLLGKRVVGGVADQQMAKAECLLVRVRRLVRANHLLADEGEEMAGHIVALGGRGQLADGAAMEDLPLDCSAADHVALAGPEPVEARLQKRLDRRWHRDLAVVAVLAQGSEHFLDEERVSVCGGQNAAPYVVGELRPAREPRDQQLAIVTGQSLEEDRRRVQLAASPVGSQLEELGPRDAEQQDRRVSRPVGEMLDQVEEDRLGPLDVVQHQNLGSCAARPSISLRKASCVSPGEVPMISAGSTPIASRISTSGQ